jgi:hypothetical protein
MSRSAFHFAFHCAFADGKTLEFVPTVVRPLGLGDLTALSLQADAFVTLQCLTEDPKINGNIVAGMAKMDGRLSFSEKMAIYALVPNGGWLPVPFVSPQHFLLDSNVVANFRKLRQNQNLTDGKAHELWTRFFEQGTALFNAFPYALEGNSRRILNFDEFVQAFEQGAREVARIFPRSQVVRYSPADRRIAYSQLQALHANTPREIEFFCEISPLLEAPTSGAKLRLVADRILAASERAGVNRKSLAVVIALSCLYEDPRSRTRSIGRRILKPKRAYDAGDAYNAICDLRHVELAAAGQALTTHGRFALCTSDKAVASLWCALGIRDVITTVTGTEYTFDFSPELFPRLDEDGIREIAGLLAA